MMVQDHTPEMKEIAKRILDYISRLLVLRSTEYGVLCSVRRQLSGCLGRLMLRWCLLVSYSEMVVRSSGGDRSLLEGSGRRRRPCGVSIRVNGAQHGARDMTRLFYPPSQARSGA